MSIVTHNKMDGELNEVWFFSTDHCQPGLSDDWVPITHYNTTPEKIREVSKNYCIEGATSTEIDNPNPEYNPNY